MTLGTMVRDAGRFGPPLVLCGLSASVRGAVRPDIGRLRACTTT
jgi:hypothetical protein